MQEAGTHAQEGERNLANKPDADNRRRPSEWYMIVLTGLIALAEEAGTQITKLANKAGEIVGRPLHDCTVWLPHELKLALRPDIP